MTKDWKEETTDQTKVDEQNEKYKKDFAELPLEKKLAALAQLEAIALGETFSFIFNSPYMVFDKVMDVMAEFGLKKEHQEKRAARPTEHEPAKAKTQTQTEAGRRKRSSMRKDNAKPKVGE